MIFDLPVFGNVSKITLFEAKLSIKVCLILCAEPTRTRNQNTRWFPNFFRRHESIEGLKFPKRATIENLIFQGKPLLHYVPWNFGLLAFRALFWKSNISLDSFWWVESNFELKSLFWLTSGIFIFWLILPLGLGIVIQRLGVAVSARRALLDSCER